jgi:threonylcarbamoyladenosine tRNA methylthiotransferase MtaB
MSAYENRPGKARELARGDTLHVFVDTNLHCEEANLDSQRLVNFVKNIGHVHTTDVRQADIIIFYACGHLRAQEDDSVRIIKEINCLKKPSSHFIVWGCLPKINPCSMKGIYDGPVVGPEDWDFFSDYFGQSREVLNNTYANTLNVHARLIGEGRSPQRRIVNSARGWFYGRIGETWYIKVESGCKNCCTYCSDRLARRWIKSVPVNTVLEQFEAGLRHGFRYFYLVGRDLGSYGFDVGLTLADLLNKMTERHPHEDYKVYLTNVSPNSLVDIYPYVDRSFLSEKTFELGSHVQSGSSKILKLMGKTFSMSDWLRIFRDIDRNNPQIRTRTSILVGFPGETEEDFQESVNLVNAVLFDRIDVYDYNERPNLPSLRLKGRIPKAIMRQRYDAMRLLAAVNNFRKRVKRARIFY